MRRLVFVTAITIAAGVSGLASGAAPRVGSLPRGTITPSPVLGERPRAIAATEKVDGIHPALPPDAQASKYPKGARYITVYGTAADAAEHEKHGFVNQDASGNAKACFTVADYWHMQNGATEWPMQQGSRASMHSALPGSEAAKQYNQQIGPQALHVERLMVDPNGSASMRFTDAWLDTSTLGARLIREANLPLAKVAKGPSGVTVFAARDTAQDAIHFVVHTPRSERDASAIGTRHFMVMRGGQMGNSDCGFARISLRNAPGAGESGAVQIEVVLPGDKAEAQEPERPIKRAALAALLGKPFAPSKPPTPREIRVRTLMVHMSVSQGASGKEPVASVSFGWQGRERRMQVF